MNLLNRITDSYFFRGTPQYWVGGVAFNRLGLQPARVLRKHLGFRFRSRKIYQGVESYLECLEEDGILVIPQFLSPQDFANVREEFARGRESLNNPHFAWQVMNNLELERRNMSKNPELFPATRKHLEENPILYKIASATLRTRIKYTSPVWSEVFRCPHPEEPNTDLENVLHADVHYPTLKVWLYMEDVTPDCAPFVYVKGSHKLSLARLKHEYDFSVRQAKLKSGQPIDSDYLDRGRNRIRPDLYQRMNLKETSFPAAANTLVIANNFGFHKRSKFLTTRERCALTMSFRFVETLHHRIYPLINSSPRANSEYIPGRVPRLV